MGKQSTEATFIKAASVADLCRYAYKFDFTSDSLLADSIPGGDRVMALGERINDKFLLIYYADVKGAKGMIEYSPPAEGAEAFRFVDQRTSKTCINVLRCSILSSSTQKKKPQAELFTMKMGSVDDIVKAAIGGSDSDHIPHLYSFDYKGKHILCGFNLIDAFHNGASSIYYAVSQKPLPGSFARYNYNGDSVEISERVGEHSYMYVKIINLTEPFPFFSEPKK